ncbi:MAG: alpha/beta hydrolase [Ignavibacteriales bacterium]|nr:alpha/beta hydrolase [Ignavibacteriales bacterium]
MSDNLNSYIINSDEIVGDIEYLHEFYSVNLKNERDIIILLPPSYNISAKRYPVLYMQDGQNLFNPITSYIGYDWKVDEVLSKLFASKIVEEIIVVGIYNYKDRFDEYNYFSEKGKKYASFLIKELKSFIDENYRTFPFASQTAVMGSSLGGLFSFQLFWNFPKIFGKAACLSNSFWVNEGEIFRMIKNVPLNITDKLKLYIDCGSEESELINDFIKMTEYLLENNFKDSLNFKSYLDIGGKHTESDWAKRLHLPLEFLFGKNERRIDQ